MVSLRRALHINELVNWFYIARLLGQRLADGELFKAQARNFPLFGPFSTALLDELVCLKFADVMAQQLT
jgi:hypothetical protein